MQTEAFLKAVFKEKEGDLTFAKAIQIAIEIEEATKVAKENVSPTNEAYAVRSQKYPARSKPNQPALVTKANNNNASAPSCGRCDSSGHTGRTCRYKSVVGHYCKKVGHIERACLKKKRDCPKPVKTINLVRSAPQMEQTICLDDNAVTFEVDTGAGNSFLSKTNWLQIG